MISFNDTVWVLSLHWRHNGHDSVSNHQSHDCLLNRLFRRRSKKISKLRVTGLCAGNSPETGEFPAQMASNAENVSIWWRHHVQAISMDISTRQNLIKCELCVSLGMYCIHGDCKSDLFETGLELKSCKWYIISSSVSKLFSNLV